MGSKATVRRPAPAQYLIEVPHSPEECSAAQVAVVESDERVLSTYQGCGDGTHTTWIIAELASEEEAWSLVPTLLRDTARVTRVDPSQSIPGSVNDTKGDFDEAS